MQNSCFDLSRIQCDQVKGSRLREILQKMELQAEVAPSIERVWLEPRDFKALLKLATESNPHCRTLCYGRATIQSI